MSGKFSGKGKWTALLNPSSDGSSAQIVKM
jgi:hypothetical protein